MKNPSPLKKEKSIRKILSQYKEQNFCFRISKGIILLIEDISITCYFQEIKENFCSIKASESI